MEFMGIGRQHLSALPTRQYNCTDIVKRDRNHHSFRRGTKIDLLFRKKVDDDDLSGVYSVSNLRMATGKDPQVLKVKKVRDWLLEFVGEREGPPAGGKARRRGKFGYGFLPDDTQ